LKGSYPIGPGADRRSLFFLPNGGGGAALRGLLASAWGEQASASPVTLTAANKIIASATITPKLTGKLAVRITGVVTNTDATNGHLFTMSMSHGGAATPTDYQIPQMLCPSSGGESIASMPWGIIVEYYNLAAPVIFPVGTPVQFNAVGLGDASTLLVIQQHGCQIEVTEQF